MNLNERDYRYIGILRQEETSEYVISVPDIPSIVVRGNNLVELVYEAERQIENYLSENTPPKQSRPHELDITYGKECFLYLIAKHPNSDKRAKAA